MKKNCLGFLIIYCCIFTWMAVPFVMADDSLLRKPELLPLSQDEAVGVPETVTAAMEVSDLPEKVIDDVKSVSH